MKSVFRIYLNKILSQEAHRICKSNDPFLMKGKLGHTIFLHYLYEKTNDPEYSRKVEIQLNELSLSISKNSLLEIYNGISGLGIGILFLYSHGVIKESPDIILRDIDDLIYRSTVSTITDYQERYENTYLDILLYISIRLQFCNDSEQKEILGRLWFDLYNKVYINQKSQFLWEPIPPVIKYKLPQFLIVSALGSKINDKFRTRITKLLHEFKIYLFSQFPQYHFNRLTLYLSIDFLCKSIKLDNHWVDYENLLKSSVSYDTIIDKEILPNDIHFTHGLSCLYILLKINGLKIDDPLKQKFIQKIMNSDYVEFSYNDFIDYGYVGLDGILSMLYLIIELKPELLNEKN